MHSCVAHGRIQHTRLSPCAHQFAYNLSMLYLDLDEAPALFGLHPLWSWNRRNLACVLRKDHLRSEANDLAEAVRDCITDFDGTRPSGPISLLTQPRYFGYCINPISVYFVWSEDRSVLQWVVLEVHNTPWDEQHPYLLKMPLEHDWSKAANPVQLDFAKVLHVSPFMGMDMSYRLHLKQPPGETLQLTLENRRDDERVFAAHLNLKLTPVTRKSLTGLLLKTPFMTLKIAAGIYYQALRIKFKGVPYVPYPGRHTEKPSGVSQ